MVIYTNDRALADTLLTARGRDNFGGQTSCSHLRSPLEAVRRTKGAASGRALLILKASCFRRSSHGDSPTGEGSKPRPLRKAFMRCACAARADARVRKPMNTAIDSSGPVCTQYGAATGRCTPRPGIRL